MHRFTAPLLLGALLVLGVATGASAASQTLKYTYDALGRATFVADTLNGNRDYDYDPAGNRTAVRIANPTDATAEQPIAPAIPAVVPAVPAAAATATPPVDPLLAPPPIPAAPSGLSCSEKVLGQAWWAQWTAVKGADYYIVKDPAGKSYTALYNDLTISGQCKSVKSCRRGDEDFPDACSTATNF